MKMYDDEGFVLKIQLKISFFIIVGKAKRTIIFISRLFLEVLFRSSSWKL